MFAQSIVEMVSIWDSYLAMMEILWLEMDVTIIAMLNLAIPVEKEAMPNLIFVMKCAGMAET